ncbi:arginine--tRNA ligase [Paractinoplanes rishiriensis]|uniref:Arginine--tRNA ligase n=1 Tax=Paractinoplanes rishiriensis TaxID=1050105 RepID=A0A919MYY3_9ACTN|nr:arginine--tRNA ligase [Actinoplanes rishiriensis]GIF00794.1 arginine--tRNA ligase [Actinoplanes rishiriensis]
MNLEALLADRLATAFHAVDGVPVDPAVRASQHADFQSGAALALSRQVGRPPREIAQDAVARADLAGLATAAVSGPGFVNLTVADEVLAAGVEALDDRLGVPPVAKPERVVIDYSGPNVAKELQIGHLRSTIIGDALARIFDFLGHDVVRANHLGDWGTQFGMLIEHLVESGGDAAGESTLADLTTFYRAARQKFDGDDDFRDRARRRVVALQSGDEATRRMWRRLVALSERDFMTTYARLGVTLSAGDFVGESSYQDVLADVVAELDAKGLLTVSDGALCAFPPGFTGRDGEPLPLIVRKSDGGFGYPATDLAAVRHRTRDLAADRLLYVVGAPQRTHFRMVFAVARQAGWLTGDDVAEHIEFGAILGTDGKMLRTRAGENIRLSALLDEADARASSPAVGIGAIKYADLAADRRSDYVFDWDRMLASTGNTGPYLQYATARVGSVFRRTDTECGPVRLTEPAERRLALALLGFEPALTAAATLREPHRLAVHLHDLAVAFSGFYETCPILRAEAATRASRLTLADRTARTLRVGLALLGIDQPETM